MNREDALILGLLQHQSRRNLSGIYLVLKEHGRRKKNWQGVIIKLALWGKKRCKTVTETGHNQNGFIIKLKKGKTPNFIYVSNSIAS